MLGKVVSHRALLILTALLAGSWLLGGCESICSKRLGLYRDTPEKAQSTANMALLVTNPNLAQAVLSGSGSYQGDGSQWMSEEKVQEGDVYRLSMDRVDDKPLYQGLCMDTTPTYACEVRPGSRQVLLKLDIFGSWGQERVRETARLTLEPGKCYFLRPDWEELRNRRLLLKVEPLPDAYTPELRARVAAWERGHSKGRDLVD
ncbi:MAG: hypothetical protein AB1424_09505 [Thermodesulfobacteriota bacterium]